VATDQGATASGSAAVPVAQHPHVTLAKAATVADGHADAAGDVINYTIDVANAGNMTLTGVAVSDSLTGTPSGVDANTDGFNDGDANHDGKLSVGETWHYTANHTVTQDEIDNNGVVDPALTISNTASADSNQTNPESASASVLVEQNPDLTITKTANVASVDAVGNVINYTVTVENKGNMTLTGLTVADPLV